MSTDAKRYFGKHAGIVRDNGAEREGAHAERSVTLSDGRLLVEVPRLLEEKPSAMPAVPGKVADEAFRPIQVVALPCFAPGFFFLPEPGDHVWVEFVEGHLDHPVWTGVAYAQGAAPKTVDGEAPKAGQKIIRTPEGVVVQLDDDEKTVTVKDGHGNQVTLDSGGVAVKAEGSVTIEASQTVQIKGGAGMLGNVALKGAIDALLEWLMSHQHMGNMGGPTPVFPKDMVGLIELMAKVEIPQEGLISADVEVG